jgi:leucyl-tRNA synthetase
MADYRDWEFAEKHGLPIVQVITPSDGSEIDISEGAYVEYGTVVNSGDIDGMNYQQAFDAIADRFEAEGRGQRKINYRLRDWGVSRQRYLSTVMTATRCRFPRTSCR